MTSKLKGRALAIWAGTGVAASGETPANTRSSSGAVTRTEPLDSHAMQRLKEAAERLRQSIQVLAQKAPGAERAAALDAAQTALIETQQAMIAMPPEMRRWGTASTVDYDKSVKALTQSAESLRQAVDPATARAHGIERGPDHAVLNAVMLQDGRPVAAQVSATARTLTGRIEAVSMKEVGANGGVSYTGDYGIARGEVLYFTMRATPRSSPGTQLVLQFRDRL